MDIKDKTIILTGGARIGKSVARALASRGANLAVSYRQSKSDAEEVADQCKNLGGKVSLIQADLAISKDVERLVREIKQEFGAIHGLVHMASIYEASPWEKLSEQDWDQNMDIIAKSAFLLTRAAADEMNNNPPAGGVKGKIVTITDWSVITRPYKNYLPYNAAKAAVLGLTKSLAKELAPDILVNAIAPGPILKPPDLTEEESGEVLKNTPLKRWGGGEEIAKAVLYLMDTDFVTGQELVVDGGRSIW